MRIENEGTRPKRTDRERDQKYWFDREGLGLHVNPNYQLTSGNTAKYEPVSYNHVYEKYSI